MAATEASRIAGEIVSMHTSSDTYGGTFGEIRGDDGKTYVYSGRQFFRNGSWPELGGRVDFVVADYVYATGINRTDKRMGRDV
jgi:hypothetical protein